jgi:hypothetical protein
MSLQPYALRRRRALRHVDGGVGRVMPVRLDGEPVTDPAVALPLPADLVPWEQVVEAYLAGIAPALQPRAA